VPCPSNTFSSLKTVDASHGRSTDHQDGRVRANSELQQRAYRRVEVWLRNERIGALGQRRELRLVTAMCAYPRNRTRLPAFMRTRPKFEVV
jgi:hypothetical protein